MKLVIRKNFSWGFAILLLMFLFQDAITTIIPVFTYFDEIESIFLLIVILGSAFTRKSGQRINRLDKYQRKYIMTLFILIIIGLIGNIISSYQTVTFILLDILIYSKLAINIIGANLILNNRKLSKYENTAYKIACIISIVLIVLVIHESFARIPIWPYMSDRYGVRSLKLFFSNQTYLALIGVLLLVIHYSLGENRKGVYLFYIIDMLISASTFRSKALGFVMVAALIVFIFERKKKITKLNIIVIGTILLIAAYAVGYEYLYIYYLSRRQTFRLMILLGGIELANMHVPFGMGFGTYCSLGAKLNYSPAYDLLGMEHIYFADAMYDNFWASVIGQLGYIGLFFYMILIVRLGLMILHIREVNIRKFWAGVLLYLYLIIASVAETSFNAFYVCYVGLFIGYLYNSVKSIEKVDK